MMGGGAAQGVAAQGVAAQGAAPHAPAPHPGLATVPDGGPKFTASDFVPHGQPAHGDLPPESLRAKPTIPMHGGTTPQAAPVHPGMATVPASPIQQHAAQHPPQQQHLQQQQHLSQQAQAGAWAGQQQPQHAAAVGMGVSPTMGPGSMLTPTPQAALAGYRVDGPGGLAPPPSARYGAMATPPMTPAQGAYPQQNQQQSPWDSSLPSGPQSAGSRNVLFLWMGVAFMAAAAILIVIWALFWR
jgi:hypothetical protein